MASRGFGHLRDLLDLTPDLWAVHVRALHRLYAWEADRIRR